MGQEFISIPVPRDRVQEVYELLARPKSPSDGEPAGPVASVLPIAADSATVERAYRESPPAMRLVFEYLASKPGVKIPMTELASNIARHPHQVAGVLGAFGRRWKGRYHGGKNTPWPFEARWSFEQNLMIYSMPADVAKIIQGKKKP